MTYILVETEFDWFNLGTEVKTFDNPKDCYDEYLKRKEHWNEHFDDKDDIEQYFEEGLFENEEGDDVDYLQQWTDEAAHYMIRLEIFERD